ncbi:hypothetical protein FA15DRAFT_511190 [Coprinopsis marcescibilis]|uniref:Uncharacterized protein n=1 Tax=Coprinopsis marcescibilis TaxID=230819 RepID=A0A5C3KQ25_COPMA|nr:hypothetical protein FA15DRAFT_511190 [Coprinopsis marcescibilis]
MVMTESMHSAVHTSVLRPPAMYGTRRSTPFGVCDSSNRPLSFCVVLTKALYRPFSFLLFNSPFSIPQPPPTSKRHSVVHVTCGADGLGMPWASRGRDKNNNRNSNSNNNSNNNKDNSNKNSNSDITAMIRISPFAPSYQHVVESCRESESFACAVLRTIGPYFADRSGFHGRCKLVLGCMVTFEFCTERSGMGLALGFFEGGNCST